MVELDPSVLTLVAAQKVSKQANLQDYHTQVHGFCFCNSLFIHLGMHLSLSFPAGPNPFFDRPYTRLSLGGLRCTAGGPVATHLPIAQDGYPAFQTLLTQSTATLCAITNAFTNTCFVNAILFSPPCGKCRVP